MDQKVIDKISKLLALATSPNENEAKAAAEKANELLIRYNLSVQDIKVEEKDFQDVTISDKGRLRTEEKYILELLRDHFFVTPIMSKRVGTRHTRIRLLGTATNVQVAHYVFGFLTNAYKRLWDAYREETNRPVSAKQSYYYGLTSGIHEQLSVKRQAVQTETGLMVIEDKDLTDFVKNQCKNLRESAFNFDVNDLLAYENGVDDGMKLKIARGINTDSKESGKYLE